MRRKTVKKRLFLRKIDGQEVVTRPVTGKVDESCCTGGSTTRQRTVIDPPRSYLGIIASGKSGGSLGAIRWGLSLSTFHATTPLTTRPSRTERDGRGDAYTFDNVCSNGCHRVEYPHFDRFHEWDVSNAKPRCNEERIMDGFSLYSIECAPVAFLNWILHYIFLSNEQIHECNVVFKTDSWIEEIVVSNIRNHIFIVGRVSFTRLEILIMILTNIIYINCWFWG